MHHPGITYRTLSIDWLVNTAAPGQTINLNGAHVVQIGEANPFDHHGQSYQLRPLSSHEWSTQSLRPLFVTEASGDLHPTRRERLQVSGVLHVQRDIDTGELQLNLVANPTGTKTQTLSASFGEAIAG